MSQENDLQKFAKELQGQILDIHCAQLAAETLRRALADCLYHKQTPWKKSYRKS